MSTYVVDTHALAWYLEDDPRLGAQAEAAMDDRRVRLIIPTIVLAEIKYLGHKGRLSSTLDDVLRVINLDTRCLVYPTDTSVVQAAPLGLDIHDSLISTIETRLSWAIQASFRGTNALRVSDLPPSQFNCAFSEAAYGSHANHNQMGK